MNRLAHALRRAGVGVGDAVGAALHNGFEWYELLNAVGKLGAQLVPIGYRLKGPEIAYMLADSGAKVLWQRRICATRSTARSPSSRCPTHALWVVGAATAVARARRTKTCSRREPADEPADGVRRRRLQHHDLHVRHHRPPEGHRARQSIRRDAHLSLLGIAGMWGFTPDDVHLVAGPLYHTGPSSYGQVHLLVGATVVLMAHYDAAEALRLIARHRVTNSFMVPTHFSRILHAR